MSTVVLDSGTGALALGNRPAPSSLAECVCRSQLGESEDGGDERQKGVTPAVCRSRDGSGVYKGNYRVSEGNVKH